jgi:hypothetical protein
MTDPVVAGHLVHPEVAHEFDRLRADLADGDAVIARLKAGLESAGKELAIREADLARYKAACKRALSVLETPLPEGVLGTPVEAEAWEIIYAALTDKEQP